MINGNLFAQTIQYSGLSFLSQNKDTKDLFPNTLILEPYLRKAIFQHLQANIQDDSPLNLSVSESFKDGTLSLIIAIDSERVASIFFNNKCLHTYSVGAQVIVFSAKDQSILSIQPHTARKIYTDEPIEASCKNRRSKIDLLRFTEIFYGLDISKDNYKNYTNLEDTEIINSIQAESLTSQSFVGANSFLQPIFSSILSANPKDINSTNFFVGIDDVIIENLASSQMSGESEYSENYEFSDFFGFNQNIYKIWAGQQFSKWFSQTYSYPIIPFVKGKALGRDVAIKFADTGEILNLTLPSLDFGFVLKIRGFKKVKLDQSSLREVYGWAAFGEIEFHNVGIEMITSIKLKNVLTEEINKDDEVDDWSNFNVSTNRILKDYVDNSKKLDKKWLSKATKLKKKEFNKHINIVKKSIGLNND
ncbi:MAG: hypothetical protein CMC94_04050 [Flavobacteriales bacterium]|nr:hypothetical protein [Flavobacteriales bacterium]